MEREFEGRVSSLWIERRPRVRRKARVAGVAAASAHQGRVGSGSSADSRPGRSPGGLSPTRVWVAIRRRHPSGCRQTACREVRALGQTSGLTAPGARHDRKAAHPHREVVLHDLADLRLAQDVIGPEGVLDPRGRGWPRRTTSGPGTAACRRRRAARAGRGPASWPSRGTASGRPRISREIVE